MNYPNPFNPTTVIKYDLPEPSIVQLTVYDILGQEVATLVDDVVNAGFQQVQWNAGNQASGIYMYRIWATSTTTGKEFHQVNKMLLIK